MQGDHKFGGVSLWSAVRITALGCGVTFGEDSLIYKKGENSDTFSKPRHHPHRSPKASAPVAAAGGTLDCGEHHRFGVWADLWGRLSNLQKGRGLGYFFEAPAPCEKPTSCVKAVMLTAVQSSS